MYGTLCKTCWSSISSHNNRNWHRFLSILTILFTRFLFYSRGLVDYMLTTSLFHTKLYHIIYKYSWFYLSFNNFVFDLTIYIICILFLWFVKHVKLVNFIVLYQVLFIDFVLYFLYLQLFFLYVRMFFYFFITFFSIIILKVI